jgi:hypothetical protein
MPDWRRREKRGVRLGRPRKMNEHRGDVARLRAQGLSGRAIAKELGVPSANVFKILKDAPCCVRVPLPSGYHPLGIGDPFHPGAWPSRDRLRHSGGVFVVVRERGRLDSRRSPPSRP